MCANKQNGLLQNVSSYHADKINYLSNPVHKIIEHHAKETPNAIAVRYCDEKMTYAELNQAANNLACYLQSRQVGAEDRIAVCLEPSVWFLVSLVGILKAGAVYVPLDPGHPQARIKHIIEECMPVFVLSERSLIERLGLKRFPFLYMDTIPQILHEKNTSCIPKANQTAYIFFTSGST